MTRPKTKKRKSVSRPPKSKAQIWENARYIMMARNPTPMPQELVNDFLTKSLASINAIQYGTATEVDFVSLMKIPFLGRALAKQLVKVDESGQVKSTFEHFEEAIDTVDTIGDRYADKRVFAAKGEELTSLKLCVDLCVSLLDISNQSHAFRAANITGTEIAHRLLVEKRHVFTSDPYRLKILNRDIV